MMVSNDKESAGRLLKLTTDLVSACIAEIGALKFDKEHPQQLYSVCSYASLIELAAGIDGTVEGNVKNVTCVPILLRAFVEGYVSLRCIIQDANYFKTMYATFVKEKVRLLKSTGGNPANQYLAGIAGAVNVQAETAKLEQELTNLKAQGQEPLNIGQAFERAGMLAEYQSIYWQLCMHAHGNISVLEDRHIEKTDKSYGVALFKPEDPADLVRYFDSLCAMLLEASFLIHTKFDTGRKNAFDPFASRLAEIRQAYMPPP